MELNRRTKLIAGGALALAIIGGGSGMALATDADDKPLSGRILERATAAALEHTGGGKVTETEIGDDGAAFGVEVRFSNGKQVEVNLNESFEVTGQEADDK
ncbi:MAG TPA: hypothetical protein VFF07_09855 [Actinomycetota bacterium]|nr:hypothetical protein [Actinomycetota bacterium]